MKHIIGTLLIALVLATGNAQTIDKERMHRDLEVAENALSTIISTKSNDYPKLLFDGDDIEARFVEGYGVIFTVPDQGFRKIAWVSHDNSQHEEFELAQKKAELAKKDFIKNSKTFLADYASIIGQLGEDHKISIRRGGHGIEYNNYKVKDIYVAGSDVSSKNLVWPTASRNTSDSELIIEVSVKDIHKLRKGKMSRDDFFDKVSVVENVMDYSKDADLETLSAMMHRLYEKDLSKTYYSIKKPKYSKLTNFGVIMKMKFYSSYEDNNIYSMPTISKKGLSLEERNKLVMDLLPQFEKDFKENIVNYGRTLKNLDSNEVLLFDVNMTTCKKCKDFPKTMKFTLKKSVLHKYNRGEITLENAMNQIGVERILD